VLGVYVAGRSREKSARAGQAASGLVGDLIKVMSARK
jgi:hypothetical protein